MSRLAVMAHYDVAGELRPHVRGQVEALAASVPGTTLEVFEQSGHFPHLTEPGRLAEVLARWVRDTPAVQVDPAGLTARLRAAPVPG